MSITLLFLFVVFCKMSKKFCGGNDMKVFTVQEIWGDGDSNPKLLNLMCFENVNKAFSYCEKQYKTIPRERLYSVAHRVQEKILSVNDVRLIYDEYDIVYGLFSGFLVKDQEVL
jgi:hypothetical protein